MFVANPALTPADRTGRERQVLLRRGEVAGSHLYAPKKVLRATAAEAREVITPGAAARSPAAP